MTEAEKIADILITMKSMGMIDLNRAAVDAEYAIERINMYLEAKNMATQIFKDSGMPL